MIAIIDYDAGNIKSVEKALQFLNEEVVLTRDAEVILQSDGVVLPGVGAFGEAMEKLHYYDLVNVIHKVVERQIPLLGICLGQHLLFEQSEESPGVPGIGVLEGEVLRIPSLKRLKIPHTGWNSLRFQKEGKLFQGIPDNAYVYFVHSYYLFARDSEIVAAETEYGVQIHSAIEKDNIFACQFHPEKSSDVGMRILQNFIQITHS